MKKEFQLLMLFKKIIKKSNREANKIWADKGSEFCNRSMKSLLEINDIEMHSTHNEENLLLLKNLLEP